ncbi:MAG: tetratricopeptide repeat protein [Chitinophagaceae bacterium]|nr:tetratricopeptide repeat protein [Chitinophagaceae bacterium]
MQRKQLFIVGGSILVLLALYFLGDFTSKKVPNKPAQGGETHMAEPGSTVEAIDFQSYLKEAEQKLTPDNQSRLSTLKDASQKDAGVLPLKDLAEFWESQKDLNAAAFYYKKAAFLENTEKSITFAGNLLLAVMQKTEQPAIRKWQAQEAVECFNKALSFNPENPDTKIALATCYTEGTGETMKGVTLLREVTQKDSNNISANIILGKLAIQSGQLDKAIKRFELVLSLRPDNTEAMYFLAEAYKNKGNKEKAIALFEQCKKLVNHPEFTKEIDNYIKTFK